MKVRKVVELADVDALAKTAKNELEAIFYNHDGRRMSKWHHYLALYQRYFTPVRNRCARGGRPLRFLEIGVWQCGSLEMWKAFFGKDAIIFGVDINKNCAKRVPPGCEVRIGSQDDPAFLAKTIHEMGGVDVILDDGSHLSPHQIASFRALFPLLAPGGIYACEDLTCSYKASYDGGHLKEGTFIELMKRMIDDMHGWCSDKIELALPECNLARMATGIHLHDGISFIEKRDKGELFKVIVDRKHPPALHESPSDD